MIRLVRWWVGLALLVWTGSAGAAVVLQATSATVDQPGDVADVCVVLDAAGAEVAGTQNDLVWDGSCATLPDNSACRISPASGKELHGNLLPQLDFTYRALVLSLADVDPIPDGELYCCAFQVDASPGACCAINLMNAGASNPSGIAEPVIAGAGARVCVRSAPGSSVPAATAVPAGSPIPPGHVVTGSMTDNQGGCQVGPRQPGAPAALLPLVVALLLAVRRSTRGAAKRTASHHSRSLRSTHLRESRSSP